jgi:hypothetical protein
MRPPQSPVWHAPLPPVSNAQPVRAHNRPDHPGGAGTCTVCPGSSLNPVVGSCGVPAPASVPGQMGWEQ